MPLVEVDWELYCIIMLMRVDPVMDRAIRGYARRFIAESGGEFYRHCEEALKNSV